jgi:hypothetical protein
MFEAVGMFGGIEIQEDLEWCQRAVCKGFRLGYAREALVGHPARRDWNELKRKWLRMNFQMYRMTTRTLGGRLKWIMLSLAMLPSAMVHTVKVIRSKNVHGFRQRLDAIGVLYKLRLWRMVHSFRLLARIP